MAALKNVLLKLPVIGRILRMLLRAMTALKYYRQPMGNVFRWLLTSNESTNFTYDLQPLNVTYLASLIAEVLNTDIEDVITIINELELDQDLRKHIATMTSNSDYSRIADAQARYGRRIGWYAFARLIKPKLIVETGVDKGLGSCILTAALMRNKEESYAGEYIGTDINPKAGYLLSGNYAAHGRIIYGDSLTTLKSLTQTIDLFINDSNHDPGYEGAEYEAVAAKLSPQAIILGDNSHNSDKLFEFSQKTNRHFVFFQEKPLDHWYPGAGIGISY